METKEQKVLEIDEVVGKSGRITTSVILYVDYEEKHGILVKVNSHRKIFIKVKKGKDVSTSVYEAHGFMKMDQLYELHNEAFGSNFDSDEETKITLIETT
jgi:hypothetical protein